MRLADLLANALSHAALSPAVSAISVAGLEFDSRRVQPGDLFFAFAGAKVDGRQFAAEAMRRGAVAVVSELPAPEDFAGPWVQVPHGRKALALAARQMFGAEQWALPLTGITGTNGKTTTSYLVDHVLRAAGRWTALVGTIEYWLGGERRPAVNTTPESLELYRLLAELQRTKPGPYAATMEVSSHALALGRVWGMAFHTAVFTNLTRDHLDFHGTMENYFGAKCELFRGQDAPPPRYAVINEDDEWGRRMELVPGTERMSYGLAESARIRAIDVHAGFHGLRFRVQARTNGGAFDFGVKSPLLGSINVSNILAACGVGLSLGVAPEVIAKGIANCAAVPGRFERLEAGQPFLVLVDYAHTDDALRNALRVARTLNPKRVLALFGCGGDRDRAKRPLMGMAAGEGADFVLVSSDNPRSEDPVSIINDALVGVRRFDTPHEVEPDRTKGIQRVLALAAPGDVVLIAGKGHETYQVLKDRTIEFDDRAVAREALAALGWEARG
jgi:UDP-N-acetylmuramoyl-L-alanyl-D-glutamate--2,6-diaminopimelate ligase